MFLRVNDCHYFTVTVLGIWDPSTRPFLVAKDENAEAGAFVLHYHLCLESISSSQYALSFSILLQFVSAERALVLPSLNIRYFYCKPSLLPKLPVVTIFVLTVKVHVSSALSLSSIRKHWYWTTTSYL